MDERSRELERRAATGSTEDELALFRERLRSGDWTEDDLRLLCYAGNQTAAKLLDLDPWKVDPASMLVQVPVDLGTTTDHVLAIPAPTDRDLAYRIHASLRDAFRIARSNVVTVSEQLLDLGFPFDLDVPYVQRRPSPDVFTSFSQRTGVHVPWSLTAFLEEVGEVDFAPEDLQPWPEQGQSLTQADPLQVVVQLEQAWSHYVDAVESDGHEQVGSMTVDFAGDGAQKAGYSGGLLALPTARTPLVDAKILGGEETFLQYVRRSIRWAGFPEIEDDPNNEQPELLEELLAGIRPF